MGISKEKFGGVYKHGLAAFRLNFKTPVGGPSEGILYSFSFSFIFGDGPITIILFHHEYFGTNPFKQYQMTSAQLCSIQADIV